MKSHNFKKSKNDSQKIEDVKINLLKFNYLLLRLKGYSSDYDIFSC